jgi:hypothetical protein
MFSFHRAPHELEDNPASIEAIDPETAREITPAQVKFNYHRR